MLKQRNPVVLVHGIYDKVSKFRTMSTYLKRQGWEVYCIQLTPNNGIVSLDKLAIQLAEYIEDKFHPFQPIDLIGFSMGGLITRYYLQRLGGISRVQRYLSISAPNNGTLMAYSLPFAGIKQMRPNSEFIKDLNRDCTTQLNRLNFTILWTQFDLMIIPADSSRMPVGKEIHIPVLVHAWMVSDWRTLRVVENALNEPIDLDKK